MKDEIILLKDHIINSFAKIEKVKKEIAPLKGEYYVPSYSVNKFYNEFFNRSDSKVLNDMIEELNIEYFDDSWTKWDRAVVYLAGSIGILTDILITQTGLLKPVEKKIKILLQSSSVKELQDKLDNFSNSFRDGESAPIDFQHFEMYGVNSIHEQYSFGHDPLRFIEGILQIMTGNYRGVNKWGNIVVANFGKGVPNLIHAVISYIAHMISDFLNLNSLPYPGSTFLMQFGSEKVRKQLAAAYWGKLYNSRIALYQSLPVLIISIIIHAYAIFDYYTKTKEISLFIGNSTKYQPMLLVSNGMVATSNLTINSVRLLLGQPHVLFKVNWPVIINTVKHSIRYFINEHRKIKENAERIKRLRNSVIEKKVKIKSMENYLKDIEKEFQEFLEKEDFKE